MAVATFDEDRFEPVVVSTAGMMQFFVPMMDWIFRVDDAGQVAPGVADSWELAPDGKSWILRIHKGITFHNGDALTAKDVKFTVDRYLSAVNPRVDVRNAVASAEVVDDYTVRINTKGLQIFLPLTMSYYSPAAGSVQPKDYIEKNGMPNFERRPIGSGPYKFVRHAPAEIVEFEAVDKHWRKTAAFKKMSEVSVPDPSTRVALLKTGAIDMTEVELDDSISLEKAGFRVIPLAQKQTQAMLRGALDPGSKGLPTFDIRVRQALSLSIDRASIIKDYLYGKGTLPLPGLLQAEWKQEADIPYWQDQAAKVYARYDPEEAKRLLREAGYPQGFSITVVAPNMPGGLFLPRLGEILASYWRRIGVNAVVNTPDYAAVRPEMNLSTTPKSSLRGNVQVNKTDPRPNPVSSYNSYISLKGAYNLFDGSWPEVGDAITAIGNQADSAKRKELVAAVVKRLSDSWVSIPIAGFPYMGAIGPKVDYDARGPHMNLPQYVEYVKHAKQ